MAFDSNTGCSQKGGDPILHDSVRNLGEDDDNQSMTWSTRGYLFFFRQIISSHEQEQKKEGTKMDHNHGPEYFLLFNHENFARMITNDRHVLGERHGEELKMFG